MAVLALAAVTRVPGVSRDTAVGVAIPTLFGLGVLLALSPATPAGLETLLFGDPLGATDGDLVLAAALAVAVPATLARARHRLLAVGLERGGARGLGVRAGRVELLLLALLAATALVAVQGLGTLLVVALLVAPAVVARGVAHRLGALLVVAPVAAVALGVAGVYLSYYAGVAAGAAVAGLLVAGAALSGAARALRGRTWWAARARGPRPARW
jgi:ABC-type Mn2+/Zn2+ transport system permease subunit